MFKPYKGTCIQCEKDKWIVNTKGLCDDCRYMNNHGGKTRIQVQIEKEKQKPKKTYTLKKTPLKQSNKPLKRSRIKSTEETKEKRKETLRKERELYRYIFDTKPPICEECNKPLPTEFEDENGNIIGIWQYSHVLAKNSFPEYRHEKWNMQRLCLNCHQIWDFGNKKSMKIYPIYKEVIKNNTGKDII